MPTETLSPLADYFAGHARPQKKLKATSVVAVCVTAVAFVPIAGTVLAGNITTGTQSAEFGQGSLSASQCDDVVTVSLTTEWYATGSYFRLSKLDLGDVNLTSCLNKTLTVNAYDASGNILDLSTGAGNSLSYTVTSSTVASPVTGISSSASVPLTVDANVNSTLIQKVTVETSSSS